ncbi:MAG: hypothetical protein ACYDAY_07025 [Candidatus Dormibacteria bacterium]
MPPPGTRLPAIGHREMGFPALVGALAVLATLPSIWIGWWRTPPGDDFTGFTTEAADGVSYLAKMGLGATQWLWNDQYTSEPHPGVFIYPFYIGLGRAAAWLGANPVLLFHAARAVLGLLLTVAVYRFCATFFSNRRLRRLAFVLGMFGGGVGFALGQHVTVLGYQVQPLESNASGSVAFEDLFLAPHFALAGIAMLSILTIGRRRTGRGAPAVAALVGADLVLSLTYPQVPFLAGAILLTVGLVERSRWSLSAGAIAILVAVPYTAYALWLRTWHPVLAAWPPRHFPVGDWTGFLLSHLVPLLLFGLTLTVLRHWPRQATMPVAWVVWAFVLIYLTGPGVLQRDFYLLSVPFGILAVWGLLGVARLTRRRWLRRRLFLYLTPLICMSSVYAFAHSLYAPWLRLDANASYVSRDLHLALVRLRPEPTGGVMNAYLDGLFVPAYSLHPTFAGHPDETIDQPRKLAAVTRFFGESDTDRARFMQANGLRYLVFGPAEAQLARQSGGGAPAPPVFRLLYRVGSVSVLELATL